MVDIDNLIISATKTLIQPMWHTVKFNPSDLKTGLFAEMYPLVSGQFIEPLCSSTVWFEHSLLLTHYTKQA